MSALTLPARAAGAEPVKQPVSQHLQCSSCSRPVFNAYQTPHGCRLCEPCTDALPPHDRVRCPGKTDACRDEEEEIDICRVDCFPDIATRRDINKLLVRCPNRPECKEQMKWRDVDDHLNKCVYQQVTCKRCGLQVPLARLDQHEADECEQRLVKCDLCNASVVYSKMLVEHKNLTSSTCCPSYIGACPFCRKPGMRRRDFVDHKPNCRERPTPCIFRHLGCNRELARSELERHCRECADEHLKMLEELVMQMGNSGQLPAAASMPPAMAEATPTTGATEKEVKDFERRLKNLQGVFKKLQLNAADWANTTMNYEELLKSFNGINGFRGVLKSLDDRARQISEGGGGGGGSRVSADSPAATEEFRRLLNKISELSARILALEHADYNGNQLWKVENVARKIRDGREGRSESLFSPPFFLGRYGHVFRLRLVFSASHVSASLVLMQGEYDDINDSSRLFDVKIRLVNLGGQQDVQKITKLETSRKPKDKNDLSIASSNEQLCQVNELENSFVKDDCMYLETKVALRTDGAVAAGSG